MHWIERIFDLLGALVPLLWFAVLAWSAARRRRAQKRQLQADNQSAEQNSEARREHIRTQVEHAGVADKLVEMLGHGRADSLLEQLRELVEFGEQDEVLDDETDEDDEQPPNKPDDRITQPVVRYRGRASLLDFGAEDVRSAIVLRESLVRRALR